MSVPPEDAPEATGNDDASTERESSVRRIMNRGSELSSRFVIEEKLGEGAMGEVFAAFDRVRSERVAVKLLGRLTPQSIVQMKREFRTAAELAHPNLVRLHELSSDGVEWYFSMELVDGITLPRLLQSGVTVGHARVRRVFFQLASALSALHREGAMHGDLKPSNFLIARGDERVVLLDFGLSRTLGPTQDQEFAGTPAYMAPEQAMGERVTEAADWYSFGVVLYEAMAGELPKRWPSARRLTDAPEDLGALCLRLLALRPGDRPTGDEVLVALGSATEAPEVSASLPPSHQVVLFGRNPELSALDAALERTRLGAPALALVHGPSGIGKTALVEQFVLRARARGALVLAGRCRERESMGYKAVDGLIDDLVRLLGETDAEEAAALLPEDIVDLTVLFPALLAAPVVAHAPKKRFETPDQSVVLARAVSAFVELLRRLRARAEVVVWLDDLQWSDRESALLLGRLLGGPDAVPLLLLGAYRDDHAGRGPLLDTLFTDKTASLPEPTDVPLGPLRTEDAERLALDLLPKEAMDTVQVARRIGLESGGHPLFIAELSRSTDRRSENQAGHRTLSELVERRVSALPEDARELLEVAAVAGTPLSRSVLREARGLGPGDAQEAIDVLRASRLARSTGLKEDDSVDLSHDRIREIVVQTLTDDTRRRHHRTLARVLESRPGTKPDVLASHYEAIGELERAGDLWIEGGHAAFRALAFEHSADLFEQGLRLAKLPVEERRRVRVRQAEGLAFAGKGPAAADVYLSTAATSPAAEALELRRRAAEQLLLSGHIGYGLDIIEQVLNATGMRKPLRGRLAFLSVVAGRLVVRARGLRHTARSEKEVPADELARVDAAWTVASSLSVIDHVRGADFQNTHLLLALRAGEPRRVLRALTLEVPYAAAPGIGSERRTADVLAIVDRLSSGTTDQAAIGLLSLSRGIAAYLQERLESAVAHFEAALDVFTNRCTGVVWEIVTTQRFLNAALFFLGRLAKLSAIVPKLLSEAEGKGNIYATMCFRTGYSFPAWLVHDDVAEAHRQLRRAAEEWTTDGYQLSHGNALIGHTFVDFYTGDAASALARMRRDWPKVVEAQLLRIGVLRVQLHQLRAGSALLAANAAEARGWRTEASELRRDARRCAELLAGDRIRRAAPLSRVIEAALDAADGDVASARGKLDQAARQFDELGLRLFAAAARVRSGALTGGRSGELTADSGLGALRSEGVVVPERMVNVLAPGFR